MNREILVADFFAGIGLDRAGLELAGTDTETFRPVFANDHDHTKKRIYEANFGEASHYHVCDIRTLKSDDIPPCDLVWAGFPCTSISAAGARGGIRSGETSAVWSMLDLAAAMQPQPLMCVFENVTGLLTQRGGADLAALCEALKDLGFSLDVVQIDAAHFVPQSRKRVFVIAKRVEATGGIAVSELTESAARPRGICKFIRQHAELPWRIRPLAPLPSCDATFANIASDPRNDSREWFDADRFARVSDQLRSGGMHILQEAASCDFYDYFCAFRRERSIDGVKQPVIEIRTDGRAGCLRNCSRGGSSKQLVFRAGRGEIRCRAINSREAARLMGADAFQLDGREVELLSAFGDAVAVPVVAWLARNYVLPIFDARSQSSGGRS